MRSTAAAALVRAAKERLVARQNTQLGPRHHRPWCPPGVSRRMGAVLRATIRAGGPEAAAAVAATFKAAKSTPSGAYSDQPRLRRYAPYSGDSYRDRRERDRPTRRSASTWTVQLGEVPISYVSHESWEKQPRPERGQPLGTVDEPFRGCTLEERHPSEPKATYSQAELGSLCPTCGTLVIHWGTHVAGQLHYDNTHPKAKPAAVLDGATASGRSGSAIPTQTDVVAALRVLQATRPDLIASSLRHALPQQSSLNQRVSSSPATLPPPLSRRSRWDPADKDGSSSRKQSRPFVRREELAGSWSRSRDTRSTGYSSGSSRPSGYWR